LLFTDELYSVDGPGSQWALVESYRREFFGDVWMPGPRSNLRAITAFMHNTITDKSLPFLSTPENIRGIEELRHVVDEICKYQWRFCPLVLDSSRLTKANLHPNQIVPVSRRKSLDPDADLEDDETVLYEAQWNPECLGILAVISALCYCVLSSDAVNSPSRTESQSGPQGIP
jgi:hypothetical protein